MYYNTWECEYKSSIPKNANILNCRLVLSIKGCETETTRNKALIVSQGHRDSDKASIVHSGTNILYSSIKLISPVTAIKGFHICSHDFTQAYVTQQSP